MKSKENSLAERYITTVMQMMCAPEPDRSRIETDLREHLKESAPEETDWERLVERMGDPREIAAEFMSQVPLVYAGFWRRLAAFVLDMAIIVFLGGITAGLCILLSNVVPQHPATVWDHLWGAFLILVILVGANACITMILAYFPLLEGRFGQTLGKRVFHLRVLSEEGLPANYWQAILRRLSFYFEIWPIDALFIPFSAKRQRGFDTLAKTIVVRI